MLKNPSSKKSQTKLFSSCSQIEIHQADALELNQKLLAKECGILIDLNDIDICSYTWSKFKGATDSNKSGEKNDPDRFTLATAPWIGCTGIRVITHERLLDLLTLASMLNPYAPSHLSSHTLNGYWFEDADTRVRKFFKMLSRP